jgi:hypothetical protein
LTAGYHACMGETSIRRRRWWIYPSHGFGRALNAR